MTIFSCLRKSDVQSRARKDNLQSLDYSHALPQQSLREFLQFMHFTFQTEKKLRAEKDRTLQSPIISEGEEQWGRSDLYVGIAQYALARELGMEHLESSLSHVWVGQI